MADSGDTNMKAHERTYLRFLGLTRFGIGAVVVIVLIVLLLITR